jgi:addiction module RelE/StbE family toxin
MPDGSGFDGAERVVVWTQRAQKDLESIGDFIARDNPSAAASWIERLMQRVVDAAIVPDAGRLVPELGRSDVREVFVRSYRIVYRVEDHRLVVLTVFEGHRQMGTLPDDG